MKNITMETILEEAQDLLKILTVLDCYCINNINQEAIYNISGIISELKNKTDIIISDIHKILE